MLELGMNSKNKGVFSQCIKSTLGIARSVNDIVPRVSLEVRNLGMLTEAKEVHEALKRDLGNTTAN